MLWHVYELLLALKNIYHCHNFVVFISFLCLHMCFQLEYN